MFYQLIVTRFTHEIVLAEMKVDSENVGKLVYTNPALRDKVYTIDNASKFMAEVLKGYAPEFKAKWEEPPLNFNKPKVIIRTYR